ncbi:MAG: SGNH/GDSL hydrolase family protein [Armatimonadota bacterium]
MSDSTCDIIRSTHIVCFGDSVTQGVPHVAPADTFISLLERRLTVKYRPEMEICAHNAGVGGENTHEGLARIESDVLAYQPDLVVVEFGLNDIRYEPEKRITEEQFAENLRRIHEILTGAGAKVVFMTPNPIIDLFHVYSQGITYYGQWGGCNGLNAIYAGIVREVAAALAAPLADIYEVFIQEAIRAEFRGETFDYTDLSTLSRYISSRDGVHPTAAGQALIAEELYRIIVRENLLVHPV